MVTHNGTSWLADSLVALNAQLYPRLDVVIVDNGSAEPVTQTVKRFAPEAELVRSERNLGFGAACNAGLESSARTSQADYFLFVHDDVELEPEACSMLIASAIETGAGVIGGKGLDWNHPDALVEFGMSADQFCLPYSALDEGEIDQGQYEKIKETLYVSSACFMVSRELAERCGLWDGAYFALGDDLDLCIRARLAGFKVMVAPAARFRHVEALARGLRQSSRKLPLGMMARRNQLRTIAKNASLPWMLFSLTGCVLLGSIKVVLLLLFRRFKEVPDYPQAFVAFLKALPNIMLRRRAVQKRRAVPDRKVRQFMIKDSHRVRVQLERRVREWERGTVALGARTISQLSLPSMGQRLTVWIRQPYTVAMGAIILILLVAARQTIFGAGIASGSIWPFPSSSGRFLSDYVSGWRNTALGTESAAPVAFPILWIVSLMGFGSPGLSQKLLLILLVTIGLLGIHRLVARTTQSRPAGILAVAVYALGPVTRAMVSGADLGALAMFAGLPYILSILLRVLPAGEAGDQVPLRPPVIPRADQLLTSAARLALIGVPVVALGPSNFVALTFLLLLMCVHFAIRSLAAGNAWTRVRFVALSIPLLALVLVPWSLEALRPRGAILGPLFSGGTGSYFALWSGLSLREIFTLSPGGGLVALVAVATTLGALLLASPGRRAESRVLASALAGFAVIGALAGKGMIPPPVASPAMWLAVPLALVALMAGHLVSGIQEDLPRHAFGWRHKIAIPAVSLAMALGLLIGWVPQLLRWDRPEATFAGGTGEFSASIASFLQSTAQEVGEFRVLWLGERWADPVRAGLPAREGTDFFLTGANGLTMLDGFQPPPGKGEERLESLVGSLIDNRLHLAGNLLAPANVRFVIADTDDQPTIRALRRQRGIALEQQQSGVAIFRNLQWLPRASLVPPGLGESISAKNPSDTGLMLTRWSGGRAIPSRSPSSFSSRLPRTSHSYVLVGDNFNSGWKATVDGEQLDHAEAFGWANGFRLPGQAKGEIKVYFAGNWVRFLWLLVQVVLLLAVVTMARNIAESKRPAAV